MKNPQTTSQSNDHVKFNPGHCSILINCLRRVFNPGFSQPESVRCIDISAGSQQAAQTNGMNQTTIILIVVGVVVLILILIALASRGKSKTNPLHSLFR